MERPRNSTELTPRQVEAIQGILNQQTAYLLRLIEGMERRRFPPYDPLFAHARRLLKEISDMRHYLDAVIAGFASFRPPEGPPRPKGETRGEQLERWKKQDEGGAT